MDDRRHPAPPRFPPPPGEGRRFQAWMSVAMSLFAVVLVPITVPLSATLYDVHLLAAFATSIMLAGSLPIAVRWPWPGAALAAVGMLTFAVLSAGPHGAPWPWPVTTIVSQSAMLVVIGIMRPWRTGVVAWFAGFAVTAPFAFADAGAAANVVTASAVTALALAVAMLVAQRRRIGAELFRERANTASEQERRMLVEERNRVARELHDVVAHGLSIIHVQATSAPYRIEGLSEEAKTEFAGIATSARTAMTEMRQLLGVLRGADAGTGTAPQPGLRDLPELVASVERAGVPVTLALGEALPENGVAATTAYRVVQEALSNVVRHAPGARTHVSVESLAGDLVVSVENEPPSEVAAAEAAGGGHGLIGMRERATLLGGTVDYGERPGGGYRVLVTLPLGSDGVPTQ